MGFTDSWKNLMIKLHLNNLTDKIDKYVPSYIVFFVLIAIIICIILILTLSSSKVPITLEFYLNDDKIVRSLDAIIDSQQVVVSNGSYTFDAKIGSKIDVTITTDGFEYEDVVFISSNVVKVVIPKETIKIEEKNKFNILVYEGRSLFSKSFSANLSCVDTEFSETVMINDGKYVFEAPNNCKTIRISASLDNYLPLDSVCNSFSCKVELSTGSDKIPETNQNLPKGNVIVQLKDWDGKPVSNVIVVLENSYGSKIDSKYSDEFGKVYFEDLVTGNYVIQAVYQSISKRQEITVSEGSPVTSILQFLKDVRGYINVNLKTEDYGDCQGILNVYKDNSLVSVLGVNANDLIPYGVIDKGNYSFDFIPGSSCDSNYFSSLNNKIKYDLEEGNLTLNITISEIDLSEATKLMVTVNDLEGNPVKGMIVFIEDALNQGNKITAEKTTNKDGNISSPFVLQPGTYVARAYKDVYLEGKSLEFTTTTHEVESGELFEQSVLIYVDFGSATVSVSAIDELNQTALASFSVDIYANGKKEKTYSTLSETSYSAPIRGFSDVYAVVKKDGYLDYVSEKRFLMKDKTFDVKAVLLETARYLEGEPKIEFLGVYDDESLSKVSDTVDSLTDKGTSYYYGFKIIIPKEYAQNLDDNSVYFTTKIAGNDAFIDLPFLIEEVHAPVENTLYREYTLGSNENIKLADANSSYRGRLNVTKSPITENGFVFYAIVKVLVMPGLETGTPLIMNYGLTKNSNGLTNVSWKSVYQYVNVRALCDNEVCVDLFDEEGYKLENERINIVPNSDSKKFSFDITFGDEYEEYFIYNGLSRSIETITEAKKNPITYYFDVENTIFNYKEYDNVEFDLEVNNNGPVFADLNTDLFVDDDELYDALEELFKENSKFNYNVLVDFGESSDSLNFTFLDQSDEALFRSIDLKALESDAINVDEDSLPEFFVESVDNKITPHITNNEEDYLNEVKVKMTYSSGGNWYLCNEGVFSNTYAVIDSDNDLILPAECMQNSKLRLEFSKQGYVNYILEREIGGEYIDAKASTIEITVPNDEPKLTKELSLENKSNVEFTISNIEIISSDNAMLEKFINLEQLKNEFLNLKIPAGAEGVSILFNYNRDDVKYLIEDSLLLEMDVLLSLKSGANEVAETNEQDLVLPLKVNFIADYMPEAGCLEVYLEQDYVEYTNLEISYLEGLELTPIRLNIINRCELAGQSYEFSDFFIRSNEINVDGSLEGGLRAKITNCNEIPYGDLPSIDNVNLEILNSTAEGTNTYCLELEPYGINVNTTLDLVVGGLAIINGVEKEIDEKQISLGMETLKPKGCIEVDCKYLKDGQESESCESLDNLDYNVFRLPYDLEKGVSFERNNSKLFDNTRLDAISEIEQDGQFVYNRMKFTFTNNCDIDLKMNLCDEDSEYYEYCFANSARIINSVTGSPNLLNVTFDKDNTLEFVVTRPEDYSGALAVPITISPANKDLFVDFDTLLISVESSEKNPFFTYDPFIAGNESDLMVFENIIVPELDLSIAPGIAVTKWYSLFKKDVAKDDYPKGFLYKTSLNKIEDNKLSYTQYDSGYYDCAGSNRVDLDNFLSVYGDEASTIYANTIPLYAFLYQWQNYWPGACGTTCAKEHATRGEARLYLPNIGKTFNISGISMPTSDLFNDTTALQNNSTFYNKFKAGIIDLGEKLDEQKYYDYFPYFITMGFVSREGDSGKGIDVYNQLYCPNNTHLIYVETYLDDRRDTTEIRNTTENSFLYGGYADIYNRACDSGCCAKHMAGDGGAYGDRLVTYRALAVCKLNDEILYDKSDIGINRYKQVSLKSVINNKLIGLTSYARPGFDTTVEQETMMSFDSAKLDADQKLKNYKDCVKEVSEFNKNIPSNNDNFKDDLEAFEDALSDNISSIVTNECTATGSEMNCTAEYDKDVCKNIVERINNLESSLDSLEEAYYYESLDNSETESLGEKEITLMQFSSLPDDFFYSGVKNCAYGGFTGKGALPRVSYAIDAEGGCLLESIRDADYYACDLKEFADTIGPKIIDSQTNNNGEGNALVALMYDNYSNSSLKLLSESTAFWNTKEFSMLKVSGQDIQILQPGIYHLQWVTDNDIVKIYVSSAGTLTNRFEYFLPRDGLSVNISEDYSSYGSCVDNTTGETIKIKDGTELLSSCDTFSALKQYTQGSDDFKTINTTRRGVIFGGNPSGEIYWNNSERYNYAFVVPANDKKELIINSEYALESETLKGYDKWIAEYKGKYSFAVNLGLDIDYDSGKIIITNPYDEPITVSGTFYVPNGKGEIFNKSSSNISSPSKIDSPSSLSEIFENVESEDVCVRTDGGKVYYYFNPSK